MALIASATAVTSTSPITARHAAGMRRSRRSHVARVGKRHRALMRKCLHEGVRLH